MALTAGTVNDHITYIDNGLLDLPGIGTTYLIRGADVAIVETGTSLCAPTVLAGLEHLGVRPHDIRHIVLTHIHMDHAGGAGTLLRHMPEARVYIHSMSIPHLIDPTRLMSSAQRTLGPIFAAHGTVDPIGEERIVAADELRLDLGRDVVLQVVPSPGHSPDHLGFLDLATGAFITGDSIGMAAPRYHQYGPVTPPPTVDVEAQQRTYDTILHLPITKLLFSHFGPSEVEPRPLIEQLRARFVRFADMIREGVERGHVDEAAVRKSMIDTSTMPDHAAWVLQAWVDMSIRGMTRYYTKRQSTGSTP